MILLSGADLVLPDRVVQGGTIAIDGERISDVSTRHYASSPDDEVIDLRGLLVVPGFIDVHVHGVDGMDTLDGADAIERIARRLPRYGVSAFSPTSVACSPDVLRRMLLAVGAARTTGTRPASRVLPAHLESNFINPDFKGAQPLNCLRSVRRGPVAEGEFSGDDILREIETARPDVGIVTVAPELDGCLDLIRDLVSHGHHVSLGHSGASYAEGIAGIEAGARQATHLFNRMAPFGHRSPGLAGAVLGHEEVVAEVVCDGVHVHPAMVRIAVAAKRPAGIMAITDGTAGSGLPRGSRASLGGQPITVRDAAYLDDGTMAGSTLTMDRAFATLVNVMGFDVIEAAAMCSTTPARTLGLHGLGAIVPGAFADLTVLDQAFNVAHTFIAGAAVWSRG
jgi:N-acetylglucosamine-6-phosphate deacetylase